MTVAEFCSKLADMAHNDADDIVICDPGLEG